MATYAAGSGTSALTFSYTVAPGQNTSDLVVVSLDLNGGTVQDGTGNNADLSGATNYNPAGTLRIDTTVPAAPTGLSLDPTTDGGTLGDGITNLPQVEIDGTAEPGSTVTLYDTNGTTVIGTGTANAGTGAFSIVTSTLSSGAHSVTAKATDTAGNIGAAAAAYSVTIDTAAPTQPIGLSLDVSTDSGTLGDGITSFVQLEIDGTAEPGSTVTLYDTNGTTVIGTGTANGGNGAFSIITSTLSNGTHGITANAKDAAGNTGAASAAYSVTIEPPAGSFSEIDTLFSGISVTTTYPPHNGLAVGANHIVMVEGSRIEWTNLSGGQATLQSVYNFFSSLNPTGGLHDPRVVYDSVNQRFIVIMEHGASGGTVSAINIAVSKDADPNHGWYFASLNTSLTINDQLTSADRPMLSVDGTNIYITAPMYNVNVSGYAGTASWVIGATAGAGGGLYNGGTMTVVANQLKPPNQGIFTVVDGDNGKAYYASSYSNGSQIVVTLTTYDVATNTFGATSTIGLGQIDQGGSYTAQQLGTNLLLNAGDKRIGNLVYASGFLYGVSELKPIGASVPQVHWFKIDVSNPNTPVLVAQGDISGASIGVNVATFNASIAVNAAGDVLINFTASGPNMYPSDYYVFQVASDPPSTFSAPISYQASTGYFNSGNGASVQPWGLYSSAIADPNNPASFWISNEYVANGWWQTSVAQIEIHPASEAPTLTISNSALTLPAGGSVPLGVSVTPHEADDTVTVTISGLTDYETVSNNLDQLIFSGDTITLSAAQVNSGLTLHSSYGGTDKPVNILTITATNTSPGEFATSAAQTITVTDPPMMTSAAGQEEPALAALSAPPLAAQDYLSFGTKDHQQRTVQDCPPAGSAFVSDSRPASGPVSQIAALLDQFMAAGFHRGQIDVGAINLAPQLHNSIDRTAFLSNPTH